MRLEEGITVMPEYVQAEGIEAVLSGSPTSRARRA